MAQQPFLTEEELFLQPLDPNQGVDPALLQQLQRGQTAQSELDALQGGSAMANALRMQNAEFDSSVRGSGLSATAPGVANALANVFERYQGGQRVGQMEAQAKALRGEVDEGTAAKTQVEQARSYYDAQQKRLNAIAQMRNQQLQAERRRGEELADREYLEDQKKQGGDLVELVTPDGEPRMVRYNKNTGKTYLGETEVDISNWKKPKSKSGTKPTGTALSKYQEAVRLRGLVNDLGSLRGNMSKEELKQLDNPEESALIELIPFNPLKRIAEEKLGHSDSVRTYLTRNAMLESRLSQLASGLQVTGYEMTDRQRWSPNAPGISDEERQRRLNNIRRDLFSQADAFEQLYPDYAYKEPPKEREEETPKSGIAEGWTVRKK